MTGRTPKFDRAIEEYFANLKLDERGGQWRTCRFSGEKFYVRPEDVEFYRKIKVPLPTLSPSERWRRRAAYLPSYQFFKVKSALDGKPLISVYPAPTPFKIYDHQKWFSDAWDPLEYGTLPASGNNFFSEFRKLQLEVPRPNLNTDTSNVNSDYTNNSAYLKNCYMTFDSVQAENLYYCESVPWGKDCVDCWVGDYSDSSYKSWGTKLYKCAYCHYCYNCMESFFLYDCTNCEHCFMSSNLRNKKYYFYNQQLSKEEYEKRIEEINLGNYETFQKYLHEFEELKKNAIRKNTYNLRAVNSIGDFVIDSRDCFDVFFAIESEHLAYSQGLYKSRDSYDTTFALGGELLYEFLGTAASDRNYAVKFSSMINSSRNLEYCDLCLNSHDCFGCIGLRNKSFCIFNKQYAEDEYWARVDEIKTAMLERGEYGEFFPPLLSAFPYRASFATAYPGFDNFEEVKQYGYQIQEIPELTESVVSLEVLPSSKLPLDIKDADDSILDKVILDEEHNKKFRIARYELEFYRKYNLPLPRIHWFPRMNQWRKDFDLRLRFFERPCARCGKMMQTTYAPDRPEKNVWCEACYLQEII